MYFEFLGEMKKMLGHVDRWLDKAKAHAEAKRFDPNVFVGLRLAPDQLPFAKQVQIACDTAKLAVARLTGKPAPSHADTEQTIDELKGRVAAVLGFLDGVTAQDFDGAATRTVTQPRWEGKTMTGAAYFVEHAVPNFFFHVTHVYAILRHNGVELGKADYLGQLSFRAG
jgi:hypothetical protein